MRILLISPCLISFIGGIILLIRDGFSWDLMNGVIFIGGLSLFIIFQKKWETWLDEYRKSSVKSSNCVLQETSFYFPKGYYFRYGFLKNRKELPFELCSEIRTNTFPITAVIHTNEVIFLRGLSTSDLTKLKQSEKLKQTSPTDNWELLCEEFLDTEFSLDMQQRTLDLLNENGISYRETKKIRKRLRLRMLIRTSVSWEWQYYGHFDVLHELWPVTKKKYWWTMDIALRNENKSL